MGDVIKPSATGNQVIYLCLLNGDSVGPIMYRIADSTMVCNHELPVLASLKQPTAGIVPGLNADQVRSRDIAALLCPNTNKHSQMDLTYDGLGWLGGAWRHIRCWSNAGASHLLVDPDLSITIDGSIIRQTSGPDANQSMTCLEALLGPALGLALSTRGIWMLHASAVCFRGRTVAFMGRSGAGKSTLADFLGCQTGWQQAADDILPVRQTAAGLTMLPHFPQLKRLFTRPISRATPPRLKLDAIYLLEPAKNLGEIAIQALSTRQAALALIGHTAAARLFDPARLSQHLAFCTEVACTTPIRILHYPRHLGALPQVRYAIEADIA